MRNRMFVATSIFTVFWKGLERILGAKTNDFHTFFVIFELVRLFIHCVLASRIFNADALNRACRVPTIFCRFVFPRLQRKFFKINGIGLFTAILDSNPY